MALDLDAFETWRAIAKEPEVFAPIKVEAAKAARRLIVKFLKSKSVDLTQTASIRKALGKDDIEVKIGRPIRLNKPD